LRLFYEFLKQGAGMETYLTIDEMAEYLKLSEQTIRKWVFNREIPYRKIKKVIRFRVSEIEKWIEEGGYTLPDEQDEGAEADEVNGVFSLEELAEMEQGEEQKEDEL
jgi:excisionase family DNA binding protein